jgi:hypothetical protein
MARRFPNNFNIIVVVIITIIVVVTTTTTMIIIIIAHLPHFTAVQLILKKTVLSRQALHIRCSAKKFLTVRHVLSITAF